MKKKNPNFDKYKHRVTLCFKTEAERSGFLGQLSDGWGEGHVSLDWAWRDQKGDMLPNGTLEEQELVAVYDYDDGTW